MPDSAARQDYAIGIDVGVTNVKSVCVSGSGRILSRHSTPTLAQTPGWPMNVRRAIEAIEAERGQSSAIGLAAPGLAGSDGSSIAWMQGRLEAVQGLDWTQFLERDRPVPVLNDAHAALLGETWIGAAAGSRNVMLLTLGTGVGGALMIDGRLLHGHIGRAGHLGHISLDPEAAVDIVNTPGSLEEAIGNCTVFARSGGRFNSTHDLIAAHLAGDAGATEVWLRSVKFLAAGIASLINVTDPEIVIIGGGIAAAGVALFSPLSKSMDSFEWRPHGTGVKIVPAGLGEFAGAIGAARNTMDGAPISRGNS